MATGICCRPVLISFQTKILLEGEGTLPHKSLMSAKIFNKSKDLVNLYNWVYRPQTIPETYYFSSFLSLASAHNPWSQALKMAGAESGTVLFKRGNEEDCYSDTWDDSLDCNILNIIHGATNKCAQEERVSPPLTYSKELQTARELSYWRRCQTPHLQVYSQSHIFSRESTFTQCQLFRDTI